MGCEAPDCALCGGPVPQGRTLYCSQVCARRARRRRARHSTHPRQQPVAWAIYATVPIYAGPETSRELVSLTRDPHAVDLTINGEAVPLYAAPTLDPNRVKEVLGASLPDWFGPQLDVLARDICEALL